MTHADWAQRSGLSTVCSSTRTGHVPAWGVRGPQMSRVASRSLTAVTQAEHVPMASRETRWCFRRCCDACVLGRAFEYTFASRASSSAVEQGTLNPLAESSNLSWLTRGRESLALFRV